MMELQWNLCPFCGNKQIDPYKVDMPIQTADQTSDMPVGATAVAPTSSIFPTN
jgi:hypothetical protein